MRTMVRYRLVQHSLFLATLAAAWVSPGRCLTGEATGAGSAGVANHRAISFSGRYETEWSSPSNGLVDDYSPVAQVRLRDLETGKIIAELSALDWAWLATDDALWFLLPDRVLQFATLDREKLSVLSSHKVAEPAELAPPLIALSKNAVVLHFEHAGRAGLAIVTREGSVAERHEFPPGQDWTRGLSIGNEKFILELGSGREITAWRATPLQELWSKQVDGGRYLYGLAASAGKDEILQVECAQGVASPVFTVLRRDGSRALQVLAPPGCREAESEPCAKPIAAYRGADGWRISFHSYRKSGLVEFIVAESGKVRCD